MKAPATLLSTGISIKIESILQKLIKKSGKNISYQVNPNWITDNDIEDIFGDNSKLKKLGWHQKIGIDESILNIF